MIEPTFIPIGYNLKHIAGPQEWLKVPNVKEICSVSECISKGPPDAIHKWIHNDLGLYDSPEIAGQLVDRTGRLSSDPGLSRDVLSVPFPIFRRWQHRPREMRTSE